MTSTSRETPKNETLKNTDPRINPTAPQSTEERSATKKKKTNNKNTKKTKIESDRYQASGTENGRFEGEGGVI